MTQEHTVEIREMPASVEEYVALRDEVATTPEGGAAMMLVALLVYTQDEEAGQACLTVAVDRRRLQEGSGGYKGWQLRKRDLQRIREQLGEQSYMPRSYFLGAVPESGYYLPEPPYQVRFAPQSHGSDPDADDYKVFVVSSGADHPRPVTLHRNDRGIWKAYEWSSLLMGVRAPAVWDQDEL
jgi:hypothetical protein